MTLTGQITWGNSMPRRSRSSKRWATPSCMDKGHTPWKLEANFSFRSLHFHASDFVTESQDTFKYRAGHAQSQPLKKRYLTDSSVPSMQSIFIRKWSRTRGSLLWYVPHERASHGVGDDVRDDLVSGYLVLPMVTSLGFNILFANINQYLEKINHNPQYCVVPADADVLNCV